MNKMTEKSPIHEKIRVFNNAGFVFLEKNRVIFYKFFKNKKSSQTEIQNLYIFDIDPSFSMKLVPQNRSVVNVSNEYYSAIQFHFDERDQAVNFINNFNNELLSFYTKRELSVSSD